MSLVRCLIAAGGLFLLISQAPAQSVAALRRHYTGRIRQDAPARTLRFASSGVIAFDKGEYKGAFWDVPPDLARIVIGRGVQVTGAFHTRSDCIIEGEDRDTSVVFGTLEQRWADSRGVKPYQYCQFQNRGGVLTVRNLTARNPFAYFIRGWKQVAMQQTAPLSTTGGDGATTATASAADTAPRLPAATSRPATMRSSSTLTSPFPTPPSA